MAAPNMLRTEIRRSDWEQQFAYVGHLSTAWSRPTRLLIIAGCASLCWMILAAPLLGMLLPR